jgi:hypothetical protein
MRHSAREKMHLTQSTEPQNTKVRRTVEIVQCICLLEESLGPGLSNEHLWEKTVLLTRAYLNVQHCYIPLGP